MAVLTQIQYRNEFVDYLGEQKASMLRDTVLTEAIIKGASAEFLVMGAADGMVERGADGLIPRAKRTDTQVNVPLKDKHHLSERTGFDILTGHADVKAMMQREGAIAVEQDYDNTILEALSAATQTTDSSGVLTFDKYTDVQAQAQEGWVGLGGGLTFLWTPKAWGKLLGMPEFSSSDYVNDKPMANGFQKKMWNGSTHILHPGLPGVGTADATCYVYDKNAVGHAMGKDGVKTAIGYDDREDQSYARHSCPHGAKILQNLGVWKYSHDDTA